jgi:hypothetical protein
LLHIASWEDTSRLGKQEVRERGYGFKENHNQADITEHHEAFFDKARQARHITDSHREKAAAAKEQTQLKAEADVPQPENASKPARTDNTEAQKKQDEVPGAQPQQVGETPLSHSQQEPPTVEARHDSLGSSTEVFDAKIVSDETRVPHLQLTDQRQQQTENHTLRPEVNDQQAPQQRPGGGDAPAPREEVVSVPAQEPQGQTHQQEQQALTEGSVQREATPKEQVPEPLQIMPSPEQDIYSRGDEAAQEFRQREVNGNDDHGRAELPEHSVPSNHELNPSTEPELTGPDTYPQIE